MYIQVYHLCLFLSPSLPVFSRLSQCFCLSFSILIVIFYCRVVVYPVYPYIYFLSLWFWLTFYILISLISCFLNCSLVSICILSQFYNILCLLLFAQFYTVNKPRSCCIPAKNCNFGHIKAPQMARHKKSL